MPAANAADTLLRIMLISPFHLVIQVRVDLAENGRAMESSFRSIALDMLPESLDP
jgi:hypothetical protein